MIISGNRENKFNTSLDDYRKFYEENNGFNIDICENSRTVGEPLSEVLKRGSQSLLAKEHDLVHRIWGEEQLAIEWIERPDGSSGARYKSPDVEYLYEQEQALLGVLSDFMDSYGLDFENTRVDLERVSLNNIFIRVDKRLDYYRIFHNDTYLNEVREAAVMAFWIAKLKPFRVLSSDVVTDLRKFQFLNENFALYVLFCAIQSFRETMDYPSLQMSEPCLRQLKYAVRYWDLSKEALMAIGISLYEYPNN